MSSYTFVSAFLSPTGDTEKSAKYFELFTPLAASGLNLIVFMSEHLIPMASAKFPGVKFEAVVLEELGSYQSTMRDGVNLAPNRGPDDTLIYMAIINSKTELMIRALNLDRPKTSHYGWIDFGISKITPRSELFFDLLNRQCQNLSTPLLAIPGNWGFEEGNLIEGIVWRFCGGLFMGDAESVRKFCLLANALYSKIILEKNIALWEVNIWAHMEREGWKPNWFQANHDESMLCLPQHFLTK